jgi:hypothetical protein
MVVAAFWKKKQLKNLRFINNAYSLTGQESEAGW